MHTPGPRQSSALLHCVLFAGPLLLGAGTTWSDGRSPLVAMVLWAEPVLLFAILYALGWMLWDRRFGAAAALCLGSLAGGMLLRVPADGALPHMQSAPWADRLRGCTKLPDPVKKSIHVLTWTLDDAPVSLDDLRLHEIDLAVLPGATSPELAEALAAQLHGEAMFLPATETQDSMALVVRGAFQYCSGQNERWDIPLPVGAGERARAVLTFPEIQGAGVVPFLAVHLAQPGSPASWSGWSTRLIESAAAIGAFGHRIDPRRLVVAGDFAAPRTFRGVAAPLIGAGLREVEVPASWPAPVGGLYALDRVWTGTRWHPLSTQQLAQRGHSRSPVMVKLAPNYGQFQ